MADGFGGEENAWLERSMYEAALRGKKNKYRCRCIKHAALLTRRQALRQPGNIIITGIIGNGAVMHVASLIVLEICSNVIFEIIPALNNILPIGIITIIGAGG